MPQPRPPYTHQPLPPAEADAKATASEAIRAVRVIIGRSQSLGSDAATHPPQTGPEPERGPLAPVSSSTGS